MDFSSAQFIRNAYSGSLFPDEQFTYFRQMRHAFPTRKITASEFQSAFIDDKQDFSDLYFESNGVANDIFDYVSRNRVAALLVLKGNTLLFEHYDFGHGRNDLWISMSMAKSISTTLVGIALKQGKISSLDDPLAMYLPYLENTSYERVTIKQLLLMCSGVKWSEDHTSPSSERRAVLELQIAQESGAIMRYMGKLPILHSPGEVWNYSTGETHLVGELLRAVTDKWLADYLSENLWRPMGMEADAYWWLESENGLEIAGSGINARARDFARFGQFMANNGCIDGRHYLPDDWCRNASGPTEINGKMIPYGYMWWSVPEHKSSPSVSAFCARGIFGQRMYIHPDHDLVVVSLAARSKPRHDDYVNDYDFFGAVANYTANVKWR